MTEIAFIVHDRMVRLERHTKALESYKHLIDQLARKKPIYQADQFE